MCSVVLTGDMLGSYSPCTTLYMGCRFVGNSSQQSQQTNYQKLDLSPKRPCLIVNQSEQTRRTKKKVVFADDRGLSLTQVKLMTEPSSLPPTWTREFINSLVKVKIEDEIKQYWDVSFTQPASNYVQFRKKLIDNNVSLENVYIKNSDSIAIGTVKVKNIHFHKEVFIRVTIDNWDNFEDTPCTFVDNSISNNSIKVLYDTFSFELKLKTNSIQLEFCVGFRCDGKEFWDNNNTNNYIIKQKIAENIKVKTSCIENEKINKNPFSRYNNWFDYSVPYY